MFIKLRIVAIFSLLALTLFSVPEALPCNGNGQRAVADGQEPISGRWGIEVAGENKIRLRLQRRDDDSVSVHMPLARLQGLNSAQVNSDAQQASFQLVRDAGTFTFTGSFRGGKGMGRWTFKSNVAFVDELREHGHEQVTQEALCMLALSDVGITYIRELERAGYRRLTTSQLVGLYTNDVTTDYIASLESVGYKKLPPNELVSLRSNGITANDARTFRELVVGNIPAIQLIALESNGVTEAYIRSLQDVGYNQLTAGQLIALRTNGVTRDFIQRLQQRGYENLTVERILSLRNKLPTEF